MPLIQFRPHKHGGMCSICDRAFEPYEGYIVEAEGTFSASVCGREHYENSNLTTT